MSNYKLILADPPWRFRNWSMGHLAQYDEKWGRANGRPIYPVMTREDICKLPVGEIAAKDSLLLMWATSPMIADGTANMVMRAWGFVPVTIGFTWVKLNPSGIGWHFGLGYHTHQNAEFIFIARRGNGIKRVAKDVPSLIISPRSVHSRKPQAARERIEQLYGPVKRIELFARHRFDSWDAWGNEVDCSLGADPLKNYIAPPYTAIIDEDEFLGLPVKDTIQTSWDYGEQMRMM